MKVTKKGKKKPWIGEKLTCDSCGTEFELGPEDTKKVKTYKTSDPRVSMEGHSGVTYSTKCPFCKKDVYFDFG